ncbi:MAG TPA: protein tyrosine phosphatase [Candidatus Saccharimonadia bacterium]|nr:protein tyrosine phosphatase [Candidatus Saccharimonadia bacterium]
MVARSGGTSPSAVHQVSAKDLTWADVIFVMESKHKQRLLAEHPDVTRFKEMHVLDIPDDYQRDDPELVRLLEECLAPFMARWTGEV